VISQKSELMGMTSEFCDIQITDLDSFVKISREILQATNISECDVKFAHVNLPNSNEIQNYIVNGAKIIEWLTKYKIESVVRHFDEKSVHIYVMEPMIEIQAQKKCGLDIYNWYFCFTFEDGVTEQTFSRQHIERCVDCEHYHTERRALEKNETITYLNQRFDILNQGGFGYWKRINDKEFEKHEISDELKEQFIGCRHAFKYPCLFRNRSNYFMIGEDKLETERNIRVRFISGKCVGYNRNKCPEFKQKVVN
jgi:hypothetical protein